MAIGVFKLSKGQRSILSVLFMSLNAIQVLTGLIMVILSFYIYVSVAPILYSERAEISYVFLVIGICGMNNIFAYLFGIKICLKCLKQAQKKSTRNLLFAWTCICFYIILYLILLAGLTRKVYRHIIRSMKHSLNIGMGHYLQNDMWKLTIDRLQFDLQCCGIEIFTEWHEIPWLDKYHVNANSDIVKQLKSGDEWNLPVTPWSCCKISSTTECLHDPLQQISSLSTWKDEQSMVLDTLNTEGCIEKLRGPIQTALVVFILLVILNCLVQVVIFPISRILYTSCRNAALLRDVEGVAPGWIFGRGDFGYNRGKTLGEIMELDIKHEVVVKISKEKSTPTKRRSRTGAPEEEKLLDHQGPSN